MNNISPGHAVICFVVHNLACVRGFINGMPMPSRVLPLVPLVKLMPQMVPIFPIIGCQFNRQPRAWANVQKRKMTSVKMASKNLEMRRVE